MLETPAQKRKRKLKAKIWSMYQENRSNKAVVRMISETLLVSMNTVYRCIKEMENE